MPGTNSSVRFTLAPDRSAIVVAVSSSVGSLTFGGVGLEGFVELGLSADEIDLSVPPVAHVELKISRLTSGNTLYDAELLRQVNARGFPTAFADLHAVTRLTDGQFQATGELTFRGISQVAEGTVWVERPKPDVLVVEGEQTFDIRDFALSPPELFMIRIRPDVTVRLHLEAEFKPE